jgi:hypothetical protein
MAEIKKPKIQVRSAIRPVAANGRMTTVYAISEKSVGVDCLHRTWIVRSTNHALGVRATTRLSGRMARLPLGRNTPDADQWPAKCQSVERRLHAPVASGK